MYRQLYCPCMLHGVHSDNPDSYLYKCPLQPTVQQNSTQSLSHNIKCVYCSITHFISTAFMCSVIRVKKCTCTDTHMRMLPAQKLCLVLPKLQLLLHIKVMFGCLHHAVHVRFDDSEEHTASICRVTECGSSG